MDYSRKEARDRARAVRADLREIHEDGGAHGDGKAAMPIRSSQEGFAAEADKAELQGTHRERV